jgi:hypothetical protein
MNRAQIMGGRLNPRHLSSNLRTLALVFLRLCYSVPCVPLGG